MHRSIERPTKHAWPLLDAGRQRDQPFSRDELQLVTVRLIASVMPRGVPTPRILVKPGFSFFARQK
jgi:hypothetical protein